MQYANLQDDRPQIKNLVTTASDIKWEVEESELQALLVEASLIKKYQPPFNILLKDDKSSLYNLWLPELQTPNLASTLILGCVVARVREAFHKLNTER